jgi:hypothetical protein
MISPLTRDNLTTALNLCNRNIRIGVFHTKFCPLSPVINGKVQKAKTHMTKGNELCTFQQKDGEVVQIHKEAL